MRTSERSSPGFTTVEHGATDVVLAAAFSHSGTRITLCSADHKIRVFDLDAIKRWHLVDQWRGHDAEVLDASSPRFLPSFLAEIRRSRFNGSALRLGRCLAPSVGTISLSCGEKTHLRLQKVAAASSAYSLSRQAIMSPMSHLTSRPSKLRFGLH